MNTEWYGSFSPSLLSPYERYKMLRYYREVRRSMDLKIQQLTDGAHTVMSEKALDNLRVIRDIYSNRIEALVNLTEDSKARTE